MRSNLAWIGAVFTLIYLVGFTWFIFDRLPQLQTMELNNVGDFLAGAFGPIAFFWLILGFMQQGKELRLSADALRMQAEELKASVQQQTALVEAQQRNLQDYERSLEPLLQVYFEDVVEDFVCGEPLDSHVFSLFNVGAPCEHIYVCVMGEGIELIAIKYSLLSKGDRTKLVIDGVFEEGKVYELKISYVKTSGASGTQEFEICKLWSEDEWRFSIDKKILAV